MYSGVDRTGMDRLETPARCERSGEAFTLTFRDEDGTWTAVSADRRQGDGSDSGGTQVQGPFDVSHEYDGCPDCGRESFFHCADCDSVSCWDGETVAVTCPWCDHDIRIVNDVDALSGDGEGGNSGGGDYLSQH